MKILITNDDGIDAPGIATLEEVAAEFGEFVTVAPSGPRSGCGHQLTLGRTMVETQHAPNRFSLDAMPADCVRVAIAKFGTFDWVFSGINQGANLGADIFVSGTVAATREAALFGIPAIAISQFRNHFSSDWNWNKSRQMAHPIVETLLNQSNNQKQMYNVNLPDTPNDAPESVVCSVDSNPLPFEYQFKDGKVTYRGDYHQRSRTAGRDIDVCFGGKISISIISV